jgi:hypothetical protein
MTQSRKLGELELGALYAFFALLDDDDLRRLSEGLDRYTNVPNWWFRDKVTAELERRRVR